MKNSRDTRYHQKHMQAILTKIYGEVWAQVERSMPISKVGYNIWHITFEYRNIFLINNK